MHGYFVSLELYDAARVIANPYAYAEHRERMVQEKMEKMAETRIRSRKNGAAAAVKVNKALAEKLKKEDARARKHEERKAKRAHAQPEEDAMEVDEEREEAEEVPKQGAAGLLSDPRFAVVFQDPEYEVDQNTREYALLNPSSVAQRQTRDPGKPRAKTAVEEEEEESDKASSDPFSDSDDGSDGKKSGSESEDSDDAGSEYTPGTCGTYLTLTPIAELWQDNISARIAARDSGIKQVRAAMAAKAAAAPRREPKVRLVPLQAQNDAGGRSVDKNATFGQRRSQLGPTQKTRTSSRDPAVRQSVGGGLEVTFIPKTVSSGNDYDDDEPGSGRAGKKGGKEVVKRKGVESFGAGMERGGEDPEHEMNETERKGRTKRRQGMRSGSKNTFRRM